MKNEIEKEDSGIINGMAESVGVAMGRSAEHLSPENRGAAFTDEFWKEFRKVAEKAYADYTH